MPKALTSTTYNILLKDIMTIYTQSKCKAREVLNRILTQAYWEIGKRIVTVEQDNQIHAEYGDRLLERLSEDLAKQHGNGFSETNLRYMRQFFLANPIHQPADELDWSKQCLLLSIDNDKLRKKYEQKAVQEKWSKRQLITELKKDKVISGPARTDKTKPRAGIRLSYARGTIGVYRVVVPQGLQIKKEKPCLDLGFDVYRTQIAGIARRQHGDLVEVTAEGNARLSRRAGKSDLYTYKAYTERVVDGDTVWVVVDAGFDIVLRQKLRLRGINAPEMSTRGGKTAKAFLKRTLDSVEFIVIKTHGGDKYDRYLAGIFYLPGENDPQRVALDGIYLNQELLDHGLVDLYLGEG